MNIDPKWAWEPYKPSPESPWDLKKVGHLHRRAAFGASWSELQASLQAGPEAAVDRLLKGGADLADFERDTEQLTSGIAKGNSGPQARAWWLYRMLYSPHPLREKLTLFWHNHFATSNAKVNNAGFMLGQYRLMYRHALGHFRPLLQEMSRDPAMMVWLDTNQSKKGMPNENYARELMELFSLGIGNYTEADIREAAKAFTGWEIKEGKAAFNPKEHDGGDKTVFGRRGKFQGEDIVNLCLDKQAAAGFVVGKLYRFLVSDALPTTPDLLAPLADEFRKKYDFGALVSRMVRSNHFFSPVVYRTKVKSPVEFALGIVRGLEGRIGTTALGVALEELGQSVFFPPSVKGWDGGETWLNGQTLLARQNLALALTSTEDGRFGRRTDPAALVKKHAKKDEELVEFFLALFLQGDVPAAARAKLADYHRGSAKQTVPPYWTGDDAAGHRVRSLCRLVLTLPEFQLG